MAGSCGSFSEDESLVSGVGNNKIQFPPQGDWAVKQQYFIHDSDRGLPVDSDSSLYSLAPLTPFQYVWGMGFLTVPEAHEHR